MTMLRDKMSGRIYTLKTDYSLEFLCSLRSLPSETVMVLKDLSDRTVYMRLEALELDVRAVMLNS